MKKLTNIILTTLLTTTPLFSQEFLPEAFRDYRAKGKELFADEVPILSVNNLVYKLRFYDINKDNVEDVVEFYVITGYSKEGFKTFDYPRFYFFDLNFNKKQEDCEWLLDRNMNGLDGDEEILYDKPAKPEITKAHI